MPNTPGVNVISRPTVTAQTPPTLTDTAFIVVTSAQGRVDQPVLCRSLSDFTNNFGLRQSWSIAYDWLDAFFNEAGGGQVYVQRVVGPSAALDSHTFVDSGAANSITVNSIGPAASGLSVAIISGTVSGTYQIVVTGLPSGQTLQSYNLTTVADAVNWGAAQALIRVVAAGANAPVNAAAVALSGGSDDHADVTDALCIAALALIPRSLGCGQVAIPGRTTETIQAGVLNHALAFNRFGILDTTDSSSTTTLTGLAATTQADSNVNSGGLENGIMVCDWQVIPGLVPNTTRTVPPSSIVAALIARSDRSTLNPNRAAYGGNGKTLYSIGKTQVDWTDAQTNTLVAAGVMPFRLIFGRQEFYGFRTLTNPVTDPVLIMANAVRLLMAIKDQGYKIGQDMLGAQIDGVGHTASKYGSRITEVLSKYYAMGALYGQTSAQAYLVNTGPDVNTPTTIANRELHAAVGVVPSPNAETIYFEIANYTVAQPV